MGRVMCSVRGGLIARVCYFWQSDPVFAKHSLRKLFSICRYDPIYPSSSRIEITQTTEYHCLRDRRLPQECQWNLRVKRFLDVLTPSHPVVPIFGIYASPQ